MLFFLFFEGRSAFVRRGRIKTMHNEYDSRLHRQKHRQNDERGRLQRDDIVAMSPRMDAFLRRWENGFEAFSACSS